MLKDTRSRVLGTTAECLKAAAAGENEEWTDMYPEFAKSLMKKASLKLLMFVEALLLLKKCMKLDT